MTDQEEAEEAGVKGPPKVWSLVLGHKSDTDSNQVLFKSYNQTHPDGKDVAHNPGTLTKES